MKRIFLMVIVAVSGLNLFSCDRKDHSSDDSAGKGDVAYFASFEQLQDEAGTRVYVGSDYKVLWHADDHISMFDQYGFNQEYRFLGETGANYGPFEKVPDGGSVDATGLQHVFAVYPYSEDTSISSNEVLSVSLPAVQPYAENSFARGINTMVSVTDSQNLFFKNACGYLGVKLHGMNLEINAIVLKGNDGELISGAAEIRMEVGGVPETVVINEGDEGQKQVELQCTPSSVTVHTPEENYTEFWFTLPPMTFEHGITITVIGDEDEPFVESTDHAITIKRNRITHLAPLEVIFPDPEPEDPNPVTPVTFSWTEVTGTSLPASVKVYETTSSLNGRANHAWYAIADPKEVAVRVLYPGGSTKKTIDAQAENAGNCLVLINGGIFGSKPNGFALCDGVQTPWFRVEDDNWDVDRQYWGPDVNGANVPPAPDNKLHTVSRALFGVDASGVPGVYWSYTPSHGTVYVYDQPIPSVEGEPVRPGGTDTYPCQRASWVPYNAITCGPVLLQRGRCPINDHTTAKGYWETNYEMWADDIFGVNQRADRTAVGYTAEGKVILCIVDGRISSAQGATTLEMAAVMKGLGCVGAINLDGGGSTGMWVSGKGHINDLTGGNRAVMTTIGFFQK